MSLLAGGRHNFSGGLEQLCGGAMRLNSLGILAMALERWSPTRVAVWQYWRFPRRANGDAELGQTHALAPNYVSPRCWRSVLLRKVVGGTENEVNENQ